MSKRSNNKTENFLTILLGVLAILMIKSLFENDNSKIVSKKGRTLLSDEDKMKDVNDKISHLENNKNEHQEIFV